jgi:CheY-like chemotaxis protein
MKTVLIIDDNNDYRETLKNILEDHGLEVIESDCPDTAYRLLKNMNPPDLIVCDLYMPFTTGPDRDEYKTSCEVGLKTLQELSWVYPNVPVIALTGLGESDLERLKLYLDPIPAYRKPFRVREVVQLVDGFLESREWGGMQ